MTRQQIFPTLLILLNLGAAYGYANDWRKAAFFLSAATINFVVTF